ncbi:hypothetical protein BO71DRAFT_422970 [Aspergillus ellipticus CBS 707.79]|uniref:Nephrocystin 3-like N-terminal domain-containing protein n=1 Tax=Aspergillus ellipticus CBS 707.79 TaxID=1448320 RepID=A0A319CXR1_9EURO|nr:hypothetical protein BO71DRAFT_422970 [Aspergillus ellipticus CBS 707.79]
MSSTNIETNAEFAGSNKGVQFGSNHGSINFFDGTYSEKTIKPKFDKKRIEEEKGGLLHDWRDTETSQLLWIKGDPGKGKTMLHTTKDSDTKDTNNNRINSATAALRGLIHMLGRSQPSLQDCVSERFLDNENAWFESCEVFLNILANPDLRNTYIIIGALDECTTDLTRLLELLEKHSSTCPKVKWLVSSRNWRNIGTYLDTTAKIKLRLELNDEDLSTALAKRNEYSKVTQNAVEDHLMSNGKGTFLWVALVCQKLTDVESWEVQNELKNFPPVKMSSKSTATMCTSILGIITTVYRPITDIKSLIKIIGLCGSFLTLRDQTISLVHQSAQDFLQREASQDIHPNGLQEIHYNIYSKSLQALHKVLRQDIYNLGDHTISISQVRQPDPDPLAAIRYANVYWVDHLNDYAQWMEVSEPTNLQERPLLETFLRQDLLHWLEALSLSKGVPEGATLMLKLEGLLKTKKSDLQLLDRVHDAYRFIIHHKTMIGNYPLQVYTSAIFFSPWDSITRTYKPIMEEGWGACLQTLEGHSHKVYGQCLQTFKGHSDYVRSVAFSYNSIWLASGSNDYTVKLWSPCSGHCVQTFKGESLVDAVSFSHDARWLASAGWHVINIWDTQSGKCLHTLKDPNSFSSIGSVAFSHDSRWLASASLDKTVKLWSAYSGQCLQTFKYDNMGFFGIFAA